MAKNNIKTKSGFTIIEVVLVLAIAGLIFLMVFVALPNMQAAQRNTRRRNDYAALSTAVTNYSANNNGAMPTQIKATWLNSAGTDPDDEAYTATTVGTCTAASCTNPTVSRNSNQVYVYTSATCEAGNLKFKTGKRNFAVFGYVEDGAGNAGTYCLSSSS